MPKDYHEDLGHGQSHQSPDTRAAEDEKAFKPHQDQLDDTERARSQAGEGFHSERDQYEQTGAGQAGYRARKRPRALRKRP